MPNLFVSVINSLLPEPHASLLAGILFGTKATMPKGFYEALVTTGTLHIIALSGMNISILVSLFAQSSLFLGLGRKASSILTICLIVLFVLFVGPSPSIVRAAIMGCLTLLAIYFGRRDWGVLSLFLAAGIMLLFDFSLIKNLSFQLSFAATLGIILALRQAQCQRGIGLLDQFIFILKTNLIITLSAQLFTLPIIFFNFRRVSLISPIANLLIEWTIQPIMALGFATAILGWLWYPLVIIPAWFVWVPLTYLITVVEWLARLPGASINF